MKRQGQGPRVRMAKPGSHTTVKTLTQQAHVIPRGKEAPTTVPSSWPEDVVNVMNQAGLHVAKDKP